eukprot:9155879-Heterocapsa_arctica.AAC.1
MLISRQEGAEKHGYTDAQTYAIKLNIRVVKRIQTHMMFAYLKYIKNPLVRKDSEENKKGERHQNWSSSKTYHLTRTIGA